MAQSIDLKSIESHLLEEGVEFVGFISKLGRVIDYSYKNEINLSQEQKETLFMTTTLSLSMQRDYDDNFGAVQYVVTERENSKIVSIPAPFGSIILVMKKKPRTLLVKNILKAVDYVRGLDAKLLVSKNSAIEEVKVCL
ncbi:MAG: hypothetical protein ACREBI_07010 [Nitrosotalea sp.]